MKLLKLMEDVRLNTDGLWAKVNDNLRRSRTSCFGRLQRATPLEDLKKLGIYFVSSKILTNF